MSLCLAGGHASVKLALAAFTLVWTHTVQKTRWEEDWQVSGDRLHLVAARVEGSGAGMDPPPEAVRVGQTWSWRPSVPPLPEIVLRRAPEAGDWRLCGPDGCRTLGALLTPDADPVTVTPCR